MQAEKSEAFDLRKIKNLFLFLIGAAALFALVAAFIPVSSPGQSGSVGKDVNVVNTPSVSVNSSAASPVFVRGSQTTALAFQRTDVSFSSLESIGDIDVGAYEKIRIVVQNDSFSVSLVVSVVEAGQVVGVLDVIDVPGCDGAGGCVGSRSTTRFYEVPGRKIRFSTNADPRATGDIAIFGR